MAHNRRALLLFLLAVFLFWLAQDVFIPTLSRYLETRLASLTLVGTVLAMYGLWQVLVRLPLGILVDAVGRQKLFILGGFLLCALGSLTLGFSGRAGGLLLGRSLSGLSMGIWVPLVVVFSSYFPARESVRSSSILSLVIALSRICATALNGYLNRWGGYILAFLVSAGATALAAACLLPVPVDSPPSGPVRLRPLFRLFLSRHLLLPSLLAAVNQYVVFGIAVGFLPLLAKRLGAGDVTTGFLVTTNLALFSLGSLAVSAISGRLRAETLLILTYFLFAAGTAAAGLARSVAFLFAVQAALGFAHGIGYPILLGLSIREVSAEQRTTAMGLHQSVYAAGIFVGPWASGALADALGLRTMFFVNALICLLLGLAGSLLLASPAKRPAGRRSTGTS